MRLIAIVLALMCAFFTFYTVRLFAVTGFLQHIRGGGQGAYIGAVAFPLIALACGWAGYRSWQRGARPSGARGA